MRRNTANPAPPRLSHASRQAETHNDRRAAATLRSPLSSLWRGVGGATTRPLLLAAGLIALIAGVACSGANNGYGAKAAPPATAATQPAVAQQAASASATALTSPSPLAATAGTAGASSPAATPVPPSATPTAAPASATPAAVPLPVSIAGFAFAPATLHVPVGGSVTWTNNDAVTHTVTPDAGGIDAHELAAGAAFTQTFATPGTYSYHCAIHPFMKGSIVVG